jgi:hypothetical protein
MEVLGVIVNPFGILAAIIVNIIVGMAWYSPYLFGNYWMKLIGKKQEDLVMKPKDILFAVVVATLMATGLNSVLQFSLKVTGLAPFINVFLASAMITATFSAPLAFNEVIWEGRSIKLAALNIGHQFATYVAMALVLTLIGF